MKTYGTRTVGVVGDVVYGVFYHDRKRHIATYVPYKQPPDSALCGYRSHLVATGEVNAMCLECLALATEALGTLHWT